MPGRSPAIVISRASCEPRPADGGGVSALATVEVQGGDPLVVEVILPAEQVVQVVEVVIGAVGPQGPPGLPGGGVLAWQTVTGDATLASETTGLVLVQHTAPCTIDLPAAPTMGQVLTIKDAGGNSAEWPITVTGGAVLIDGAASVEIAFNWSWVSLAFTGAQWGQV